MSSLKMFIKCFIPYGFLALKRKICAKEKLYIKYSKIEKSISLQRINYLCNTNIKRLIDKNNIIEILREDYKYPIYVRNHTSDVLIYQDILEKHEYDFIVKHDPKWIIDAGANIGMASVYFANKYKEAKIIAIEPEKNNFNLLKLNTENYANITAINAALWNNCEELTLFDVDLGNLGFMVEENATLLKPVVKNGKHTTRAITVDKIMQDHIIDVIDILKIDIEGAEKDVLESCKNWINKTKSIIIELHERKKKGCNKAFYKIINSFDQIGKQGEDIYLSRENYISMTNLKK
jgi:FkbM family methyltransferase